MWVILLDNSGSMGEPFSGEQTFSGRATSSDAGTKLKAAVDAILERIRGRNPDEHVAIISFTSLASRLVEGPAGDLERFRQALSNPSFKANNGTDIAAAFLEATEYLKERPADRFPTVLLVTDGKSEPEPALNAQRRLIERVVQISAVLIDPTEAAENLLRGLIHNGEVQAVKSKADLEEQVRLLESKQQAFALEVEAIHRELEADVSRALVGRNGREDLCFAAVYPSQLVAERWTPLLFNIHTSSLAEYVGEQLRSRATELFLNPSFSQAASASVPRGTELAITPHLPGVRTNPREIRITWEEDIHDLTIKIRADRDQVGQRILGSIDITVDGALIGDVPISLLVSDRAQVAPTAPESELSKGRVYRSVFASYSRKDAAVVQACVHTYEALGIYVYLDKMELRNRSGEAWKEALRRFISEADVFQLYWSFNALKSESVQMEWRHALNCTGTKGQRFVRPLVCAEDFPDLPEPLSNLQLGFLKLDLWRAAAGGKEPVTSRSPTSPTALECVVIPTVPGSNPSTVRATRNDVGYAVRFLEETTGLRYYPVATLLVDEYVVRSVRQQATVDEPPDSESPALAIALADLLQALALALHVRFRGSPVAEVLNREDIDAALGKSRILEPRLFEQVLSDCKGVIRNIVRQFPGVSAWKLYSSLGPDADSGVHIASLIRKQVEQLVSDAKAGTIKTMGYPTHSLTTEEYESVREELERARIRVSQSRIGATGFSLDVQSVLPFIVLAGETMGEIEEAVRQLDQTFSAPAPPPLHSKVLQRLVASGIEAPGGDILEALSVVVAAAMNPLWKRVAWALIAAGGGGRLGKEPRALEMLSGFLAIVCELFREGAKYLSDRPVDVGYPLAEDSWSVCGGALDVTGLTIKRVGDGYWRGPEVQIEAPLARLASLFGDASKVLLRLLPGLSSSGGDRSLTITASTFGIFTQAGSPSIDDQLRSWAREAGVAPDLTLPDTSRVLLCLDALDRFREMLRERSLPTIHASLYQRSVLVHEHFHAAAASALDADGRFPQGPRHPEAWQKASPVNEALAAWMELHASDQPEIRKHVEDHIDLGQYPDWPYAGARALEAAYASNGLPAIREWIRELRDDPIACRVAFDGFIAAFRANGYGTIPTA